MGALRSAEKGNVGVIISSEIQADDETRVQMVCYGEHHDTAWLMTASVSVTNKQKEQCHVFLLNIINSNQ
ncbi:hypothetical protein C9J12_19235 [Photobacterium frigidiphilum]|uniref:Uncharacterized protein n=1 Tax=Photobacterium frigidiphilum TaxID=264736 RepID=A0A2T3JBG8_9GAMM|nr:hypothetical protein C9J12_19235 [Photobacterium frigidiphilum]